MLRLRPCCHSEISLSVTTVFTMALTACMVLFSVVSTGFSESRTPKKQRKGKKGRKGEKKGKQKKERRKKKSQDLRDMHNLFSLLFFFFFFGLGATSRCSKNSGSGLSVKQRASAAAARSSPATVNCRMLAEARSALVAPGSEKLYSPLSMILR